MAESPQHQRLVAWLVRQLRSGGALVTGAALPGWPRPRAYEGYVPDVIATHGRALIIGEAETPESIDSEHTVDQLLAFASAVELSRRPATVALVVPAAARREAVELVEDLVLADFVQVFSPRPPRRRARPAPVLLRPPLPRPTEQELRAAAVERLLRPALRQRV